MVEKQKNKSHPPYYHYIHVEFFFFGLFLRRKASSTTLPCSSDKLLKFQEGKEPSERRPCHAAPYPASMCIWKCRVTHVSMVNVPHNTGQTRAYKQVYASEFWKPPPASWSRSPCLVMCSDPDSFWDLLSPCSNLIATILDKGSVATHLEFF